MIWTVFTAFCFKSHEIHKPTLMEFLSSKAVMQRLTENERWRAIGLLQNGSIRPSVARQFNVSQSVISRLWNCYQQTENVTGLPHSGCPHSTTRHQGHLLVTNALRDWTQNACQLQQQFFRATRVWVTTQTVRHCLYVAQLLAHHLKIVLPLNANHDQAKRVRCQLCQRFRICSQFSYLVASNWRALPVYPRLHKTAVDMEVSWFGEGSPWLGGQNSTSNEGMSLGSTTTSLSLLLRPTPVGTGMHASFMMTMQETIVHVLSKITCSFCSFLLLFFFVCVCVCCCCWFVLFFVLLVSGAFVCLCVCVGGGGLFFPFFCCCCFLRGSFFNNKTSKTFFYSKTAKTDLISKLWIMIQQVWCLPITSHAPKKSPWMVCVMPAVTGYEVQVTA